METTTRTTTGVPWPRLLAFCAWLTLAGTVLLQAAGRFVGFPSLVLVDLAMVTGLLLLRGGRRRVRAGAVVIGVFSLLNNVHAGLFLMAVMTPEADPVSFLTCLATWIGSLLAIPVAVAVVRSPDGRGPAVLRRAVVAVLGVATAAAAVLFLTIADDPARPGDLQVARERDGWGLLTDQAGRTFAPDRLTAGPGTVTVAVTNTDPLVGLTFLVPDLGVAERVAPGSTARVTFDAPAGSYRFLDDTFLVEGTLVVG
ncbi:cupredoxin domain-containing protein [Pseudonocardia nematodicida]|uniref:Cupredoxin domain-containing protein n=1 Tax=Pseudonocardia nematodicida TaxID=1206997 RepID=A0ABV1KK37_9PSEU